MWTLQYVREVENKSGPRIENTTKTYTIDTKEQLKDCISNILSVELLENKDPIEPTLEYVKKYNLYNNDINKIDSIFKFFKKNYERYLNIVEESNDFEKEEYKYQIVEQCDRFYLDTLFDRSLEIFRESYIIVKKVQNEK